MAKVTNKSLIVTLAAMIDELTIPEDSDNPLSNEELDTQIRKAEAVGSLFDKIIDLKKLEYQNSRLFLEAAKFNQKNDADKRIVINDEFYGDTIKALGT